MPPIELKGPRNTITVEMAAKGSVDVGVALLASVAPAILTGVFLTTGALATATATVHAPEVSYGATVETGGPATATATVYASEVSYGAEVTAGAPATATATVYAPDVAVSAGVVTGPPATATAAVYAPTVSYGQAITTGAPATATATAYAPEVDAGVAVSVTGGAPATATAAVYAPDVSYGQSLTAGAPATATATVYAPTVTAGASFTPADLFAASEAGAWYDPSDLTSMNTLSDGTGSQPAVGDPVGRLEDKSGNANHALQATAANRPILRQTAGGKYYLEFDGVNDFLVKSGIGTSSDWSSFVAAEGPSWLIDGTGISGGRHLIQVASSTNMIYFNGLARNINVGSTAGVVLAGMQISSAAQSLRFGGAEVSTLNPGNSVGASGCVFGTDSFGENNLSTATFATLDLYSAIRVGRYLTTTEVDDLEAWMADKAEVAL